MLFQPLNNQQGSMSLVLTIGITAISAIVIFQMSSTFGTLNQQQSRQKVRLDSTKQLQEVSGMLKKSLTMGQLDPSCANEFDGSVFKPVVINGHTFCFPRSGGLCAKDTETGDDLCVSTRLASLQIPVASKIRRPSSTSNESTDYTVTGSASEGQTPYAAIRARHTRINVPDGSDKLWRNCDGPSDICLRIVICPNGTTDCEVHGGEKFQVINLSTM